MKVTIYICAAIIIIYLGYLTGKTEPQIKIIKKQVTKTISAPEKFIPKAKEKAPEIKTEIKDLKQVETSPYDEFIDLPTGRDKFIIAARDIDEFLQVNPDELSDDLADLYAEQIKYIFDWSQPDAIEVKEWVEKISTLKSAEFKTDIFEYMIQARLIKVEELEKMVIQD